MGGEMLLLAAAGSLAGSAVGLGMFVVAWRHRDVPGATEFGTLGVGVTLWCLFAAGQAVAMSLVTPASTGGASLVWFFERLVRVSAAQVAPLILVFLLAYAGRDEWLTPRWMALLWVYPVVYSVLSLSAPWHGLASTPADVTWATVNGITAPVVPKGPVEYAQVALGYVAILLGLAVLARLVVRSRAINRRRWVALVVAVVVPVSVNVANHAGLVLHPGVDLTPTTFVVAGTVLGWALYAEGLLSVTPLPSHLLVEELPDPVFVLDEDETVVDLNPAASRAFPDPETGAHVSDVAPGLLDRLADGRVYSLPGDEYADGGPTAYYDPHDVRLDDQHGTDRGRLVVLRDVTGQKRRQSRLEALQTATQQFITATTEREIADLAVDFAERAMTPHAAAVFLRDADAPELQPVAVTRDVEHHFDESDLVLEPGHPMYDSYEADERRVHDAEDDSPFERYATYPLGEHGLLAVGTTDDESFATDDVQFASILARTTQVALTQVERERELRRRRASIERRNEQIEFFNGVLRHTLRNALLVIRGRADYLRGRVDDEAARHVDRIDQWCDDLAELNEEIRVINETVTASETERLDVVDLSSLLHRRTSHVDEEYPDATVSVDVPPEVYVQANDLASELIDTLLTNAVQHNDGDEATIHVTMVPSDDWVQVRIADDGPGMDDELKETVFERDVATSQTSHGFGLYFVSVMMNLYGGAVWFEDNAPRGTVAVLEFLTPDEVDPSEVADRPEAKRTSAGR